MLTRKRSCGLGKNVNGNAFACELIYNNDCQCEYPGVCGFRDFLRDHEYTEHNYEENDIFQGYRSAGGSCPGRCAAGGCSQRLRRKAARNSFVTKRAEAKLDQLASIYKDAAGERFDGIEVNTLQRMLRFHGFHYLDSLRLDYNWENRFVSVNYNLEMVGHMTTSDRSPAPGECLFRMIPDKSNMQWVCSTWSAADTGPREMILRNLEHHLIRERIRMLDIVGIEIFWSEENGVRISCETMIGITTWILIPPVTSFVAPTPEEAVRFYELFELLGDAFYSGF